LNPRPTRCKRAALPLSYMTPRNPKATIAFLVLTSVILSGCATVFHPPADISVGKSRRYVDPSDHHESLYFPCRLTNTSAEPIWFYGLVTPSDTVYTRAPWKIRWTDDPWRRMCAFGKSLHKLPPGASASFWEFMPESEYGRQFRLEISVFKAPDLKAKPLRIRSQPVPVK
jgi:hypothetical protein